jgi:hypothetical protein
VWDRVILAQAGVHVKVEKRGKPWDADAECAGAKRVDPLDGDVDLIHPPTSSFQSLLLCCSTHADFEDRLPGWIAREDAIFRNHLAAACDCALHGHIRAIGGVIYLLVLTHGQGRVFLDLAFGMWNDIL